MTERLWTWKPEPPSHMTVLPFGKSMCGRKGPLYLDLPLFKMELFCPDSTPRLGKLQKLTAVDCGGRELWGCPASGWPGLLPGPGWLWLLNKVWGTGTRYPRHTWALPAVMTTGAAQPFQLSCTHRFPGQALTVFSLGHHRLGHRAHPLRVSSEPEMRLAVLQSTVRQGGALLHPVQWYDCGPASTTSHVPVGSLCASSRPSTTEQHGSALSRSCWAPVSTTRGSFGTPSTLDDTCFRSAVCRATFLFLC